MLPKRFQRRWPHGGKRTLGVRTESYARTDFPKGRGCFIDVDGEVGVFEETDGETDSADAAADDGDVDG